MTSLNTMDSVSDDLMRQGGLSTRSSEIAEAEENFRKSVSNLSFHSRY